MCYEIGCEINTRCKKRRRATSIDPGRMQSNELQCITVYLRSPKFAKNNINHTLHCAFKSDICVDIFMLLKMYWNQHHRLPESVEQFEEQMSRFSGLLGNADKPRMTRIVSAILAKDTDGTWLCSNPWEV